jgi:hypothetical protein
MNTTPNPGDDSTMVSSPHPTDASDGTEALAALDPADAVEPAEELARRLAAALDAEGESSPAAPDQEEFS